jgi:hypothetical protein
LTFNDIEGAYYDAWPLGHSKLDSTAQYTRVATKTIRDIMSPLDCLTPLMAKEDKPECKPPA